MITREKLLSSPEFWFEEAQNELFSQVSSYMKKKGINKTELSQELNVTKGYVTQILNGEFNFTLKKLIELSLAIGKVPKIEYLPLSEVVHEKGLSITSQLADKFVSLKNEHQVSVPQADYITVNQRLDSIGITDRFVSLQDFGITLSSFASINALPNSLPSISSLQGTLSGAKIVKLHGETEDNEENIQQEFA